MAGKFTAILMAILIAAPFCCCLAKAVPEAPATEAHACCQKSASDTAPGIPEPSKPCDCHEASKNQLDVAPDTKPAPPQWKLLARISWERLPYLEASSDCDARRVLNSSEASRPPGGDLLLAHCRYLL
jgi:hypothetical protein